MEILIVRPFYLLKFLSEEHFYSQASGILLTKKVKKKLGQKRLSENVF
ncbi:hypothetical protein LMG9449_1079 [Lactococcus lactis subsp. lactis]|uniref:Uncharacterized protein n=1 Tax=Lactococcus lactis subsp. lactis TaxID=1360 RepID=A0A0V8B889_LACLL|nr:hypothetical protein ATCC19435_1047 [Lactococcus lactis subsp. lactis]KSU04814.1 hypothetical protein Li1_2064 [Lactococcus lactis subsp. lactis]KSU18925.1 hypothetical protein LMG9449_1079 [Lactococcus lactis subsp. lactis]CDI47728.1 hypothetical protein BN927_01130 [Lactococcus lactis subsp. lactis Dephy 1]